MHGRRKWQPTPVFLPGESQGWGSLVGCHLWGRTESDKRLSFWPFLTFFMPSSLSLIILTCDLKWEMCDYPFTWTLRGQYKVTNWLNFNIFLSQKLGRLKEREREREWSNQKTRICWDKFAVLYWCGSWHLKTNYKGNIKGHWSQIIINIIIMKKFEIFQITKM